MAHDSLASLPSDVRHYILSFVPLHPRLVVLGTLNRRWRSLVIASLPAFPLHPNSAIRPENFIRLAPLAPPALRTLNIPSPAGHYVPMCHCQLLTHLTSLTSLSLSLGICCLSIIRRNAESLTSLSLTLLPPLNGDVGRELAALRLPHLRHCALRVGDGWVRATTFLKAHADQLTSLELSGEQLLHALHMPLCQHLALRDITAHYPVYDSIRAMSSSLVSLALHAVDRLDRVPAELRAVILRTTTELRLGAEILPTDPSHALFGLTNLRKLELATRQRVGSPGRSVPPHCAAITQRCTSLTLCPNIYFAQRKQPRIVSECLTSLTVHVPGMLFKALRHPLPNLQSVVLHQGVPLRYFIHQFDLQRTPALRSLAIVVYRTMGTRRVYAAWLQRLERAGVEQLTVVCDHKPNRQLVLVKSVWMRVIVRHDMAGDRFL